MKSNKNNPSPTPTPSKPRPLSPDAALNKEFDAFCQQIFPQQWADPDDQSILRTVWHASARQTAAQLMDGSLKPLYNAANSQFQLLRSPLIQTTPNPDNTPS